MPTDRQENWAVDSKVLDQVPRTLETNPTGSLVCFGGRDARRRFKLEYQKSFDQVFAVYCIHMEPEGGRGWKITFF